MRGILVRGNKAYQISKDHSPHNPKEKARVVKAGGSISVGERDLCVNGALAATRGLGNHGDVALRKYDSLCIFWISVYENILADVVHLFCTNQFDDY